MSHKHLVGKESVTRLIWSQQLTSFTEFVADIVVCNIIVIYFFIFIMFSTVIIEINIMLFPENSGNGEACEVR